MRRPSPVAQTRLSSGPDTNLARHRDNQVSTSRSAQSERQCSMWPESHNLTHVARDLRVHRASEPTDTRNSARRRGGSHHSWQARHAPRIAPPLKDVHECSALRGASTQLLLQHTQRSAPSAGAPQPRMRYLSAETGDAPPAPTVQPAKPAPQIPKDSELRVGRAAGRETRSVCPSGNHLFLTQCCCPGDAPGSACAGSFASCVQAFSRRAGDAQSWRHQSKSDVPAPCRLARASRARSRGRSSSTRRAAPRETRRNLAVELAPPPHILSAVMTSAFSQYALYSKKNQKTNKSKEKLRFKFHNQRKCSKCIQLTTRSMNHGRLADAPPSVGGEP